MSDYYVYFPLQLNITHQTDKFSQEIVYILYVAVFVYISCI